ncbi:hypothetical protein [Phytoactinopolyspora halotolerans]|uniref:Lipoprotein n=1 Tax=Phytoactinopolyspora halotolerans TaxID=1981512 RepID=A0A6L9SD73_9ACTN|nr:hypothetical protein [Phytoactinopolyspora halotolerans]NEE03009.1 hypothetical protein [Phytoactinopolyspora halotolerans]
MTVRCRTIIIAAFVAATTVAACSEDSPTVTSSPDDTPKATGRAAAGSSVSETDAGSATFDALTISLVFDTTRVASGGELPSTLVVENRSEETVVDPSCDLAEGRYALIPVDEPDAKLWVQPVADCGGPHPMPPGFRGEYTGPDFLAWTETGEALPPGDYLAVVEFEGRTERLTYPVTVE